MAPGRVTVCECPPGAPSHPPLAAFAASVAAGFLGGHAAFVQEYQALRIDPSYLLPPGLPPLPAFFHVLLHWRAAFFYAATPPLEFQAESRIPELHPHLLLQPLPQLGRREIRLVL